MYFSEDFQSGCKSNHISQMYYSSPSQPPSELLDGSPEPHGPGPGQEVWVVPLPVDGEGVVGGGGARQGDELHREYRRRLQRMVLTRVTLVTLTRTSLTSDQELRKQKKLESLW